MISSSTSRSTQPADTRRSGRFPSGCPAVEVDDRLRARGRWTRRRVEPEQPRALSVNCLPPGARIRRRGGHAFSASPGRGEPGDRLTRRLCTMAPIGVVFFRKEKAESTYGMG
jgi:hypothetical protein